LCVAAGAGTAPRGVFVAWGERRRAAPHFLYMI